MSLRFTSRLLTSNSRSTFRVRQLNSHLRKYSIASIPATQRGILVEKTGGVEVLEYKTDLPVPTPKEGEILVKNDFIGINYIDTFVPFSVSSSRLTRS